MSNISKAVQFYLKDLKQAYSRVEWITDTRAQIADKTNYSLRSSDRHLAALLKAGLVEHRRHPNNAVRSMWRIRNMP